ncbi:hydrogen gas-evolving membrane-bound hydrogenase subunit E [Histidinibacterium aquaticum]|uniref:DUF4040 domain-containing protein n=1 Tax=Histidinibacterium aquaticum TaxID=2613962 RepID=A0A5J5GC69_9RHOB|nr:hydrogen gas-evolving membrane-bound hydrogenase subunit E [Histidinibacterium aquaticum]KAA9005756.1 DUF4040 domain-containing protein [Histidinibacterium aquaticum]
MTAVFDILLAIGILGCAAAALAVRERTAAIAAFMVAGLLVALSWVRLGAPDVALAEAAIGAGLTGALLLRSARRLGPVRPRSVGWPVLGSAAILSAALAATLAWAVASSRGISSYQSLVAERLSESGVTNPVTAVLLNFRAWDTLLEIAVLSVALMLVASVGTARIRFDRLGEMMLPCARIVVPLLVLVSGHLLWLGSSDPGGAFQAGAVLAGAGLVLVMSGHVPTAGRAVDIARVVGLSGLAIFVIAASAAQVLTGGFLQFPPDVAKAWIIAIEAGLTLSIAATLVLLFLGLSRHSRS